LSTTAPLRSTRRTSEKPRTWLWYEGTPSVPSAYSNGAPLTIVLRFRRGVLTSLRGGLQVSPSSVDRIQQTVLPPQPPTDAVT